MDIEEVTKPLTGKNGKTLFIIAGVGAGLVALLMKKSSVLAAVDAAAPAAGSPYPGDNTSSALGQSIQSLAQTMQQNEQDLLGQMGQQNEAMLETISANSQQQAQAFSDLTKSISDSNASLVQTITQSNASLNDKIQSVYSTVHDITSQAPSITSTPTPVGYQAPSEPAKPTVFVRAGSVEDQALHDMYGDKINIQYSDSNQYKGADRTATLSDYTSHIGVDPVHSVDISKYSDPYAGHVNG